MCVYVCVYYIIIRIIYIFIYILYVYIYIYLLYIHVYCTYISAAYWLQELDDNKILAYLNLSDTHNIFDEEEQELEAIVYLPGFNISAFTLDPFTGELWIAYETGRIFICNRIDDTCQEFMDTGMRLHSPVLEILLNILSMMVN